MGSIAVCLTLQYVYEVKRAPDEIIVTFIQRTKTRAYYYSSYNNFTYPLHSRPILLSTSSAASYSELCAQFLAYTKCVLQFFFFLFLSTAASVCLRCI